jgi:phenylpropionate dioxygenase-like ring-hydroxylating dioxygenase large terminal subunit
MLSKHDNEAMCRVGPDTPMGKAMRRFWLPAMQVSDLPDRDSDPRHLELLGEHFVAFRDTNGRVGILDEACCHRGASLLLGRVEECGIRCPYHGWKFAVDGTVMETPNVADERFKDRIKANSYPVREAGGLIWVYLGVPTDQPAFPTWRWLTLPDEHRINVYVVESCNYVQVMEGTLDSTHLSVLHRGQIAAGGGSDLKFAQVTNHLQFDAAPQLEVEDTDFGFHYAALRSIRDGEGYRTEAMITAFMAPCFVALPHNDVWLAFIPVNDHLTVFFHVWWNPERRIGEDPYRSKHLKFIGLDKESLDSHGLTWETFEGPNRMRRSNYFKKDMAAARDGHFTGLLSFTQEDAAVSISSGPLRDRSREKLSPADAAITRMYRCLLTCAKQGTQGDVPLGLAADKARINGAHGALAPGVNWRTLVPNHRVVGAASRAEDAVIFEQLATKNAHSTPMHTTGVDRRP